MIFYVKTPRAVVSIRPLGGRWSIFYGEENLGSYHRPEAAADDAAGGHTFTPSDGTDLGSLGLPGDIREWQVQR